jgi:hypothetical protein
MIFGENFAMLNRMLVVGCLISALSASNCAFGAFWTGATDDDWAVGSNWSGGIEPSGPAEIMDNVANSDAVIYSGAKVVADFTMHANSSFASDHASLTVKSGASLHSNSNFDLGYFGGLEVVTLTVEQGASISADGSFLGNRPGPHVINLAGTADASGAAFFGISGATTIDFAPTGVLLVSGNVVSDVDGWWSGTVLLYQGLGVGDPGWGTTYDIVATYNPVDNTTTVVGIPEPASIALMILGGLGIASFRRNSRKEIE